MLKFGAILGGVIAVLMPAQAAPVCGTCHPKQTARFLASPMGRSISVPSVIPGGEVKHAASNSTLRAAYRNGRLYHTVSERGLTAQHPVAFQIGRGVRARTYAIQIGDYLLESPLSWYKAVGWEVSPGYESMALLDFDRPVTENCLFCHAGRAKAIDVDGRRIPGASVSAITCDRCHGAADEHIRRPSAKNIVNPARLTGPARDSVCEQCHLEGETRIPNPGKSQWDYRPGDLLEASVATYLFREPAEGIRKVVTQVEELAESKCARGSRGKLWCGSCHNPHGEINVTRVCTGCHASISKIAHPVKNTECISCHMPSRPTSNVMHIAMTEHQIRRPNSSAPKTDSGPAVAPWRQPPQEFRRRNLALAGLQIAKERDLPALATQSTKLLESVPETQQNSDSDVLSALEVLLLGTSHPEKAVALGRWAVDSAPQSATFALNYGLALLRAGNLPEAERQLVRSVSLDPSQMQAAAQLALLYDHQGRKADSQAAVQRFLRWNPQSIQFRAIQVRPATQP